MVFSEPSEKNPSRRLSADQKGNDAPSVPSSGRASTESRARTQRRTGSVPTCARKATCLLSGETDGCGAEIQFVGSISTVSNTWLWAWANPTVDAALCERLAHVRAYGDRHGIEQLVTAKWEADATDGWEMTSIVAYLLGAIGAYRTPDERGFEYMVMTSIRWAESVH